MADMTFAQILGDFVHGLSYEDLPPHVVEKAKISIADGIGCALAGYPLPTSKIALDLWKEIRTEGKTTVWVNGEDGDLESTAWVNCLLTHSILQDDTQEATVGHMGSMIIPTALATAEHEGKSGKELLTAIVAAYEVACRIGLRSGIPIVRRGFRGSPVFGTFAAAVSAGKVMGLPREQLQSAIALAANFSCGLLEASKTGFMEWRFQNGVALRNGIMAARLAQKGLSGSPTTLEGECGFFTAFGGPELRSEILSERESILGTLGKEFEVSKNMYKPYASCAYNQVGVEVALRMMEEHGIKPEEVERIDIAVAPENKGYPGVDFQGPFGTIDQAVLSKAFAMATAMKYGDLTVDMYLSDLRDPWVLGLAKKVFTDDEKGMGFFDTRVRFRLKNGKVFTGDQGLADMGNYSLEGNRIVDKFRRLTSNLLEENKAKEIVQTIFNLPEMGNVSEFSKMLRNAFSS